MTRYCLVLGLALQIIASSNALAEGYGLGRLVEAAEIAAWDTDVRPDGLGLPAGQGSVQYGERVYNNKCQSCHGEGGKGGSFDVLVGRLPDDEFPFAREPATVKTIGNYWPYASTVFDYINRAMPLNAPGSLSASEVYALVAYLLYQNDIVPESAVLSADNLPEIIMPSSHRFVPDDRRGGAHVR